MISTTLKNLISVFHKSSLFGKVFHTLDYCLQEELKDCEKVLDLGCGPSSPLQNCSNVKYSVGVEIFKPYLEKSKKAKIHTKYLSQKIEDLDFPKDFFDAVIMIDVLEHLREKAAWAVLKNAQKWAAKKVVVTSPNGFISQEAVDKNPYQEHLSGWPLEKMKKLGFGSHGLAGLKWLRTGKEAGDSMDDDFTVSIRFKPKVFWFGVAAFSQIFTYFFPAFAFGLFSVKRK